jgi:hypothetical protein
MKQVKTTKIKGNVDYAKVADRLLEFRSQNPRSKISIKYSYDEVGNLTHTARIWKDKTECYELLKAGVNAEAIAESADAEASAFMFAEQLKKEKGFEKNESIAVGRALAILGYAVSGEIASSEEMEEFEDWKNQQAEESRAKVLESITNAKSIDELLAIWKSLTKEQQLDKEIAARKDAKKGELSESSKNSAK